MTEEEVNNSIFDLNDVWQVLEDYWFFILIFLLVAFAAYIGLFTTIEVVEGKFPGGLFFYKNL